MTQPLVIAYHLIWTAYGWWLPNDPRGSGSRTIRQEIIADLGELHYGRKQVQPAARDVRDFYRHAAAVLKHPLLTFAEPDRDAIAVAFHREIEEQHYTCYACPIMPDHVHLLLRKHKHLAEEMAERLQQASRERLCATNLRSGDHPTWTGRGGWKVFLDHPDEVRRTVGYIERNPMQLGLPKQDWPFVKTYDGWPLHPGHSPNSPYARRLRAVGRYPV
jgi:REP element-mobilizing transposase RayT